MPRCCIESFALEGLRSRFALAAKGDRFTCPSCGRVYVMRQYWELEEAPVPPLIVIEDDGKIH